MATNFLHGVETVELQTGPQPVTVVKSAVIGLVGLAPCGGAGGKPVLVSNPADAAQFGNKIPGFTIPQALAAIFAQGAGTVLVVNVFDAARHTEQVKDEVQTVVDGKLKLSAPPAGPVEVKSGSASAYLKEIDYTIGAYGNFRVLTRAIADYTVLKFSYKKFNPDQIMVSDIIGDIDTATGDLTGIAGFDQAFNRFGFHPKVLIAPGFSSLKPVSTFLTASAEKLRAVALIDAPYGTTLPDLISGRGIWGTIGFKTSSKRAVLLYPHLKAYDAATNENADFPYSSYMAGAIAANDNENGFWFSPSNREIKGITGAERNLSAGSPGSDVNFLNENGIISVYNSFGTGIRTWGNRNASYPTNTRPDNFISVLRTADVIHESVEQAALQFVDRPITNALTDSIRESVNSFLRILTGRGAIVDGKCTFDKNKNSTTQMAAGQLVFDISFMPPTPGKRITFNTLIDISLLSTLK